MKEDWRVLIVEDIPELASLLADLVSLDGGSSEIAHDGAVALDLIASKPFDLVMLDLLLPKVNGQQILNVITRNADLCKIPVIVVTASPELLVKTPQVVGVIKKPFDFEDLERLIAKAIEPTEVALHSPDVAVRV